MMRMVKKFLAVSLSIVVLLTVTGCKLAREDAGENNNYNNDRLIGIFITKEYLNLFDIERYINDNIDKISDGGEITIDYDSSRYQERLYATVETRTETDKHTGRTVETKEFAFKGVEGYAYFIAKEPSAENEGYFTVSGSDPAISDGKTGVHYTDDEERIELEGTIYITPGASDTALYFNPVYQSTDGRVYTVTGNGFLSSGYKDENSVYSKIFEETRTITENGKSKKATTYIKITMAVMFPPEKIAVVQLDKDCGVLSRMEYNPGELPDKITSEAETEFIIVETYKHNPEGDPVVSRTLYEKGTETLGTFYCRDDGICVKQWTQLDW